MFILLLLCTNKDVNTVDVWKPDIQIPDLTKPWTLWIPVFGQMTCRLNASLDHFMYIEKFHTIKWSRLVYNVWKQDCLITGCLSCPKSGLTVQVVKCFTELLPLPPLDFWMMKQLIGDSLAILGCTSALRPPRSPFSGNLVSIKTKERFFFFRPFFNYCLFEFWRKSCFVLS